MADVLANLKTGNMEEVPDTCAALQAGTHGIPLYSPQGEGRIASSMGEASQLMNQGWSQPSPDQLQSGLNHAKVNTPLEKVGSVLEGGGEGAGAVYTGVPLFTAAEAGAGQLLGIKELSPEYIALRHKYNSGLEALGNVAGAGAATYFGGEATLPYTLPKAAEGALAKQFGSTLAPLGSMTARSMVQSALLSGNQELSKFMYDPSQTVEKAVSNVTLNTALGGLAGAAIGSVPALWERTSNAINTSKFMQSLKDQANVTQSGADITDQLTSSGIPATVATKAAVSKNTTLRNVGAQVGGADAVREAAPAQMAEGMGLGQDEVRALQDAGDNQIAAPVRSALGQAAQKRLAAGAQGWEEAKAKASGVVVPPEAATAHADAVNAFQGQYAKLQNTTPEWGLVEQAKKDLPNLETLQDFQNWRSGLLSRLWNSDATRSSYWNLKGTLDNWEDQFVQTAAGAIDPNAVPMLQAQRQSYADTMQFVRGMSTALKIPMPKSGPNASASQWVTHLMDPLQVPDSAILSKTTPADNDAFLNWVNENVPEAAPAINAAYKQKAVQAATSNGQLNSGRLWNYIQKNWSPQTQQQVIGQQGLAQMASTMDLLNSVGGASKGNPGIVQGLLRHFFGGVGAIAGHAVAGPLGAAAGIGVGKLADVAAAKTSDGARLALLKFLEDGRIDVPAFKAMADYFGNATTAHTVMASAVSNIINKGGSPDSLPSQAQPDPKGAQKLDALMQSYQGNPGSMYGIGGSLATYLPEHQVQFAQLAGRAQEYLQNLKPQTDPLGPLDSPKVTPAADQAKYDRALNLVNKPLSILSHIAKGNITQDDMAAMELYPALTQELQQHFMNGIMEQKAKGKTVPYQQRLALSQFLGMNLDSTIGPMTMMTLQGMQKQPGAGSAGPQGKMKKPPQSAFSRMQKGAAGEMTMAQKAEQDRVSNP